MDHQQGRDAVPVVFALRRLVVGAGDDPHPRRHGDRHPGDGAAAGRGPGGLGPLRDRRGGDRRDPVRRLDRVLRGLVRAGERGGHARRPAGLSRRGQLRGGRHRPVPHRAALCRAGGGHRHGRVGDLHAVRAGDGGRKRDRAARDRRVGRGGLCLRHRDPPDGRGGGPQSRPRGGSVLRPGRPGRARAGRGAGGPRSGAPPWCAGGGDRGGGRRGGRDGLCDARRRGCRHPEHHRLRQPRSARPLFRPAQAGGGDARSLRAAHRRAERDDGAPALRRGRDGAAWDAEPSADGRPRGVLRGAGDGGGGARHGDARPARLRRHA